MVQAEMWERMRRLLNHMFRQHKGGKFQPDARLQLRAALAEASVNPDLIDPFEKDLYSDAWHGEEGFKPLSVTQKYLIAHLMIYRLFGEEHFREEDFFREARAARLRAEDIGAILKDNWPERA